MPTWNGLSIISSWDSLISLILTIGTFFLALNVRKRIIQSKRQHRIRQLVEDVRRIPNDAIPLSAASKQKIRSLGRNISYKFFLFFNEKNQLAKDLKNSLKNMSNPTEDELRDVKELLDDWASYSEDL